MYIAKWKNTSVLHFFATLIQWESASKGAYDYLIAFVYNLQINSY